MPRSSSWISRARKKIRNRPGKQTPHKKPYNGKMTSLLPGANMKRLTVFCLCLTGVAMAAQPRTETRPDLDKTTAVDLTPVAPGRSKEPRLPFTTDTQVRVMGLYETGAANGPVTPDASENNEAPYLAIEGVPRQSVFRLPAGRAGLNYMT